MGLGFQQKTVYAIAGTQPKNPAPQATQQLWVHPSWLRDTESGRSGTARFAATSTLCRWQEDGRPGSARVARVGHAPVDGAYWEEDLAADLRGVLERGLAGPRHDGPHVLSLGESQRLFQRRRDPVVLGHRGCVGRWWWGQLVAFVVWA
eukprot:GHVU01040379.1.p3 GENE.GHVU01040379.1~~GHVU01040379.1.p3  ORF type:complete len:149 (-),score=12.47 GHVU01040379.1:197-643(-)